MIVTDAAIKMMTGKNQDAGDLVQLEAHPESANLCEYNLGRGMSKQTAYGIWGRGLVDAVCRRSIAREVESLEKRLNQQKEDMYEMDVFKKYLKRG
jgi:hypothetical protein